MRAATRLNTRALVIFSLLLALPFSLRAAETLEQLTSTAKKESDLYFVAGPTTFGGKSSTDMYLGSLGQFAHLQKENALEEVEWSKIFPWVTKGMEEIPSRRGVLVYTSPRGILYNTSLISEEKAPKKYEDLVDPGLSATWAN